MSEKYISQFKGEEIDERLAKIPSLEEDMGNLSDRLNTKIPSIEEEIKQLDKQLNTEIPSLEEDIDELKSYYTTQENVVKLDEEYIPDSIARISDVDKKIQDATTSVPKIVNYEKGLICEYIYNSADFEDGHYPKCVVNRAITENNFILFLNGEEVNDIMISPDGDDTRNFAVYSGDLEVLYFRYNYLNGEVIFGTAFENTIIDIYEKNVDILPDSVLSNEIARISYVNNKTKEVKDYVDEVVDGIGTGGGTGGNIIIDSVMSDTSKNAVQNKVIKSYVDKTRREIEASQIQHDWNQSDKSKLDYIKNRTHYSESVLLCDYTHTLDVENWEGEDFGGTFILDKELDLDKIRLYINGEYVPTTYHSEDNDIYLFDADDVEHTNPIFEYIKSQKYINFPPWVEKSNYKLYEEFIQQIDLKYIPKLDENHIPDNVPKMVAEKTLVCQYTYDLADFTDDAWVGIGVNKKLTKDNIALYINGERVVDFAPEYNPDEEGSFWGCSNNWERINFYYFYDEDIITIYPEFEDGDIIQIYEENFNAIKDSDLSNTIARTQYVDKRVDTLEAYYVEEDSLICDYTSVVDMEDLMDESLTEEELAALSKTFYVELLRHIEDINTIKIYVNGESATFTTNERGDGEIGVVVDGYEGAIGFWYDGVKTITFWSVIPKGTHIQLYGHATVLKEKHIPNSIARVDYVDSKINSSAPYIGENGNWFIWHSGVKDFIDSGIKAVGNTPQKGVDYFTEDDIEEILSSTEWRLKTVLEREVLCEYIYSSDDFMEAPHTIQVNKEITIDDNDNIALYINGERVEIKVDTETMPGGFVVQSVENGYTYFSYIEGIITFLSVFNDGDLIEICKDGSFVLIEDDIPSSIARTQYVDKKIGDIDSALDEIIALQESYKTNIPKALEGDY